MFEQPAAVSGLIDQYSRGGSLPCVWHVPSGGYSLMAAGHQWKGFVPTTDWFIPTGIGAERVLIVEADSSVGEEACLGAWYELSD